MSYYIDAIYDDGLLKPLEPLALPDQARVRLRVEVDETSGSAVAASSAEAEAQRQAMLELDAEMDGLPDLSPEDGFTSAEHDRILYGEAT